jgi:hypothetical protein
LRLLAFRAQPRPERAGGWPVVDSDALQPLAFQREDDILIFDFLGPSEAREVLGTPGFQKAEKSSQAIIVGVSQQILVFGDESGVFLVRPLALFSSDAEHIRGLVP